MNSLYQFLETRIQAGRLFLGAYLATSRMISGSSRACVGGIQRKGEEGGKRVVVDG